MRIAFWVNNAGFRNVDCSKVSEGNPGIGGTQFSAILIAESLLKYGVETIILCNSRGIFPNKLRYHVCFDIASACRFSIKNDIKIFILDSRDIKERLLVSFPQIKFIAWANCFIEEWMNPVFSKYPNMVKFVNVGKHQHELCKDMPIASKSTYIYNAVPTAILDEIKPIAFEKRNHNVVYIGSLHRAKGFHLLAKAWPKVLEGVPDANMYVIGSGKLYSRNSKLGIWNLAQEEYEDEFMEPLTSHGKLLPSVHFLGVLGKEKYDVLSKCKVGVPNPSGVSETFGYTAVEMQLMGCLVTTIKCPAYIDTVYQTCNLYDDADKLPAFICKLLLLNDNKCSETRKFIENFSVDRITKQWIDLLNQAELMRVPTVVGYKQKFYYLEDLLAFYKHSFKKMLKKMVFRK